MTDDPTATPPEDKPSRSPGVTAALIIGSLALIAAIVAIVLLLTQGDGDPEASASPSPSATESTASPTPSVEPSETEEPTPEPSETAAGGSGTRDDPYLLGETFTWDGSEVGGLIEPTTAVWEFTLEDVTPVDVQSSEWSEYSCAVVTGTITAVSWPDGQDGPAGKDVPLLTVESASGDFGVIDDDEVICDASDFGGLENYQDLRDNGAPTGEDIEFYAAVNWYAPADPQATLIDLGGDEYNQDTAVWVSATDRLE